MKLDRYLDVKLARYLDVDLVRYLLGASAARIASEGVAIALVLAVHGADAGPAAEGLFVAAWAGPSLLSGVFAGHGLDRAASSRRFLGLAGLVVAVALALDAGLLGRVPAGLLIVATAVGGAMGPLFTGGISSLLPSVVGVAALGRAQALDSATYSVAGIAGPALVALLAALFSARVALLVPAVAVVGSAWLIPDVTHDASASSDGNASTSGGDAPRAALRSAGLDPSHTTGRVSLRRTLTALTHTRALMSATASSTVAAFGWGGLEIGATAVALLDGTPHLAGVYLAVIAAGALLSALILARSPLPRPDRSIPLSLVLMTVGAAVTAASRTTVMSAAGFALFGLGDGVLLPAVLAVRARDAPTGMTAAVFTTAASLKTAATALGAAVGGVTLQSLGARGLFIALAATQLLAAVIAIAVRER